VGHVVAERVSVVPAHKRDIASVWRDAGENGAGRPRQRSDLPGVQAGLRVLAGPARRVCGARYAGAGLRAAHDHAATLRTVDIHGGRAAVARHRGGRDQRDGRRHEDPQPDRDRGVQRVQPRGRAHLPAPQARRVRRRVAQRGPADDGCRPGGMVVARGRSRRPRAVAGARQAPAVVFRGRRRAGERVLRVHRVCGQQQRGNRVVSRAVRQQPGVFQRRFAVRPVRVHVGVPFQGHQQRAGGRRVRRLALQTRVSRNARHGTYIGRQKHHKRQ